MKKPIAIILLLLCLRSAACDHLIIDLDPRNSAAASAQEQLRELLQQSRPSPLVQLFWKRKIKDKKVTAALLAFPFPCGMVGLHRIYLGTAPHIPVVYIATIGGVFGILPFVDFCVLLIDKEVEPYIRNNRVFMWSR